jgi:hypothetical protein
MKNLPYDRFENAHGDKFVIYLRGSDNPSRYLQTKEYMTTGDYKDMCSKKDKNGDYEALFCRLIEASIVHNQLYYLAKAVATDKVDVCNDHHIPQLKGECFFWYYLRKKYTSQNNEICKKLIEYKQLEALCENIALDEMKAKEKLYCSLPPHSNAKSIISRITICHILN